jgi:hypothetical protein
MHVNLEQALQKLPKPLRDALIHQFEEIAHNFIARKWSSSELSGGHFCEIVYSILDGYAKGSYPEVAKKPKNFAEACKSLEQNSGVPRSFQILIPRILPAVYEIRNNRGVGHVGGDVDPNYMDCSFVLSATSWIMAELVRVLHNVSLEDAQRVISNLSERKNPAVWIDGDKRRLLIKNLNLSEQILMLLASSSEKISLDELSNWLEYKNKTYLKRTLNNLHKNRFVEFDSKSGSIDMLPPGTREVDKIIIQLNTSSL